MSKASATWLKFWGVRGSIPVPGLGTSRYGGNTSCVEVRADGEIIVLDAGSGIRLLGMSLEQEFGSRPIELTLLISHVHWDHIQGFPFFGPAYNERNEIHICGYDSPGSNLREILKGQMATPFFPVNLNDLRGTIDIRRLKEMDFKIGKIEVWAKFMNHPGICVGYRLFTSNGSIAYLPDTEPYDFGVLHSRKSEALNPDRIRKIAEKERGDLVEFLAGADILILDAEYTDDEYKKHLGWGHGSLSTDVSLAIDAKVRKLVLFHHDPTHDDSMVDLMVAQARALAAKSDASLDVEAAREGAELILEPARSSKT
jgi:phosphoribosyl 1,2-cyclic phosphodiesterase